MPKSESVHSETTLTSAEPFSVILSTFQLLRNFEERGNSYTVFGKIDSDDWKCVLATAQTVTELKITAEMTSQIKRISRATWFRILQQLAGEPLFPCLKELHVEEFDSIIQYLPLFISPSIELIHINPQKPTTSTPSPSKSTTRTTSANTDFKDDIALEAFIVYLSDATPNLQTLCIKNVPRFSASWLKSIAGLRELGTLELRQIPDVKNFNCLRPLSSLTKLKSLTLELLVSSTQTMSQLGTMPMIDFLPTLTALDLVGPGEIVCDFIRALGSLSVNRLSIHCPVPPTAGSRSPQNGFPILSVLGDRWIDSLQELCIYTGSDGVCDLQLISRLGALRQLHLSGGAISSLDQSLAMSTTTPGFWSLLETLKLPATETISLLQLRSIAKAAPSLLSAALNLNFQHIPSFYGTKPIRHGLRSLNLCGNGSSSSHGKNNRDELSHLLDFARHIDLIFPELVSLNPGPLSEANCWNRVWDILKFCQHIRTDSSKK